MIALEEVDRLYEDNAAPLRIISDAPSDARRLNVASKAGLNQSPRSSGRHSEVVAAPARVVLSKLEAGYWAGMSREHVEIVRRQYDAFAERDWEALAQLWHPAIEYVTLEKAVGVGGRHRGLHQVTEFFDSWSDLYAEFRVEAGEIVAVGDRVVVAERQAARGLKGSSAESWVQDSFACLITFKGGKIFRIEEFPTLDAALEAAGRRG